MNLVIAPCWNAPEWDAAVNRLNGHPQQLWGWGQTKADHGWRTDRLLLNRDGETIACAQILIRRLPLPFRALVYIPRGPVCNAGDAQEVLEALGNYARDAYAGTVLSIEPDWDADSDFSGAVRSAGFRATENTILIPRTLILDLSCTEDELLAGMSKKHRQYIRKSAREELEFREVTREEIPDCLTVYRETAERAGFGIHEDGYYLDIHQNLGAASPVYAAFQGRTMVAFLWLSASDHTAFELYGGMTEEGERLRANYALKWLAIREMKERGVERYDFNGLLNDGVSKFKMGWAKHENLLMGTWDKPLSPLYPVYATAMPLARRGISAARGAVGTLRTKAMPALRNKALPALRDKALPALKSKVASLRGGRGQAPTRQD
ncbi:peptidoglycan bridge formation glycyltransferase FemA/FemB family protein [Arthrobacter tumbae]|uniref:lipid II:glycine glycyltransferase FemX n=1 Tax=Arthrobacter tumbae TaxID=163874 RepID=UPI00195B0580|nr:peptidoglycan bridge formation glycyltransferase FemA/FemB family protein [Arthrobacter tumbae]MBM7782488.1 lipid II:glycine glycyltransferase (peptidoglycan interpeptide bridge formation enzyme) [Arthrobacter tumbae]